MIKNLSKKTILTVWVCCVALCSKAQLGYNFSQVDIGAALGINQVYGDVATKTNTASIHFNFTYNQTPYTNFVFEAQFGRLAGGDSLTSKDGKQFNNDYSAFLLRGQLQLGEVIDYANSPFKNALKNLYISTGVGLVVNHITSISRYSNQNPSVYTPGENNSNEPFIPLRLGYEFKFFNNYQQPAVKIDLGLQYNLVFSDNLDGYASGKNDAFLQTTIGVKLAIGSGNTSYRKQIQY